MQENHHNNTYNHEKNENLINKEDSNDISLLSLINNVKQSIDLRLHKKIEELEFKLLEKNEILDQLDLENKKLKAQIEEKDLELFGLHEEIAAGKQILLQLSEKLNTN